MVYLYRTEWNSIFGTSLCCYAFYRHFPGFTEYLLSHQSQCILFINLFHLLLSCLLFEWNLPLQEKEVVKSDRPHVLLKWRSVDTQKCGGGFVGFFCSSLLYLGFPCCTLIQNGTLLVFAPLMLCLLLFCANYVTGFKFFLLYSVLQEIWHQT